MITDERLLNIYEERCAYLGHLVKKSRLKKLK